MTGIIYFQRTDGPGGTLPPTDSCERDNVTGRSDGDDVLGVTRP
ncbi:hypothetical protein SAMN06264855_12518 [Halorubrum vacuolatum]|uniref:Uncharacterized protein n=1 Tax=Halorubrum vacuolatum TaxID=63740 RepID=A0A238XX45_HALVU|nr:hypothetical protein SAMN06264855_12518 [Halorubrum vacuolatum]